MAYQTAIAALFCMRQGIYSRLAACAHMLCNKLVASKQLIVVPSLEAMSIMMENGGKMPELCIHKQVAKTCHYCREMSRRR